MNIRKDSTSAPVGAMSRRAFMAGIPAVGAAAIMPAATATEPPPATAFDLQGWLDTAPAPAPARLQFHLEHLTRAMRDIHGGPWCGRELNDGHGCLIARDPSMPDGSIWIGLAVDLGEGTL